MEFNLHVKLMIQLNTALMLKSDFHLKLKGTRASVLHVNKDSAVIQFLHPYNWNKNTFANIPMDDIQAYFQLAPPLYDFNLNEYLVGDVGEDRKGCFSFNLYFKEYKVAQCHSDGYSSALFSNALNEQQHPAVQRLLNSIYTKCIPLVAPLTSEDPHCLVQLELAIYLRSNLNNGAISFFEYLKTKLGLYLEFDENPSKCAKRRFLSDETQANQISIKQF